MKERYKSLNLTTEQEQKLRSIHQNRRDIIVKRRVENKVFRESLQKKAQEDEQQVLTPEHQAEYDKLKWRAKENRKTQKLSREEKDN